MPEIVTMTRGIIIASRAVASALMMSVVLTYVYAIVLHLTLRDQLSLNRKLSDEIDRTFETIPRCMWTLLVDGTFMSDGAAIIMTEMLHQGKPATIFACIV